MSSVSGGHKTQKHPFGSSTSDSIFSSFSSGKKGKIYERCELAQELFFKHKLPKEQIHTWVSCCVEIN